MQCPACRSRRHRIIRKKPGGEVDHREHRCLDCGTTYESREIVTRIKPIRSHGKTVISSKASRHTFS